MVSFDPNRPDFSPYGFTCVHWNPSPMPRPDHHNEVELNLLESGWLVYLLGGRKVQIEVGRLSVFWGAIPHQIIEFGPHTEYYVVTIPFAWFLQWRLPDNFVQPMLRGEVHCEPPPGRGRLDRDLFAQWEADLQAERGSQGHRAAGDGGPVVAAGGGGPAPAGRLGQSPPQTPCAPRRRVEQG
jgi:hypothetical protein